MAPPPTPLITDDNAQAPPPAPSLTSALLIIGGLLLFAAAAIVLFRYFLRRWRSSSSRPRRASPGAEAARSAAAAGREQALATRTAAAVREEVEVEGPRRIAEAVGRAEAHSARGRVEAHSARGPAEVEIVEVEWEDGGAEDDNMELLIASLPLFTMASALAAVPKNSPDCAVCLSPFEPDAALRLLPACRHAFHAACIDTWLLTNPFPVCPICRGFVSFPPPPLPSAPSAAAADQDEPLGGRRSFRVELGSVSSSRRRSCPGDHRRTYSLGGSFDYRVDEEVEAIVSRIVRPTSAAAARPRLVVPTAPAAPGEALAEAVGSRGWLNEHLDRVSGRWSGRLSQGGRRHDDSSRWDPEAPAAVAAKSATPAAGEAALGEAAAGTCGGGLGERRDRDNLVSSAAASFSGWCSRRWSLGHRRDESWRWDREAACRAVGEEEREPAALVALGWWVLGF